MAIRKPASSDAAAPHEPVLSSTSGWPNPAALEPVGMRDGAPVPLDAFPRALREHIAESAHSIQAPLELCALSALTTFAAAAQRCALVRILPRWAEQLSLYGVGVARPSERKSAIHKAMTDPLFAWVTRHNARNADRIDDVNRAIRLAKSRVKGFEQALARAKTAQDVQHWTEQIAQLERDMPTELLPVQLTVDDITPEQLVVVLQRQQQCTALLSDEAGTFKSILKGRYDTQADIDVWLKGYDGGRIQVERKKENSLAIVDRPRITLGLFAQPGTLREMASDSELSQRGLLARLCFVRGASRVGSRELVRDALDSEPARRYADALCAVLDLPVGDAEIEMDAGASAVWDAYYHTIERELIGTLEQIEELAGKHPARAARIAAIWHIVRYGRQAFGRRIDELTMRAAVQVAEWLLAQQLDIARWLYDTSDAQAVLTWAKQRRVKETTVRDIRRALIRKPGQELDVLAALDELAATGWARLEPGARRSVRVTFNPALFSKH